MLLAGSPARHSAAQFVRKNGGRRSRAPFLCAVGRFSGATFAAAFPLLRARVFSVLLAGSPARHSAAQFVRKNGGRRACVRSHRAFSLFCCRAFRRDKNGASHCRRCGSACGRGSDSYTKQAFCIIGGHAANYYAPRVQNECFVQASFVTALGTSGAPLRPAPLSQVAEQVRTLARPCRAIVLWRALAPAPWPVSALKVRFLLLALLSARPRERLKELSPDGMLCRRGFFSLCRARVVKPLSRHKSFAFIPRSA